MLKSLKHLLLKWWVILRGHIIYELVRFFAVYLAGYVVAFIGAIGGAVWTGVAWLSYHHGLTILLTSGISAISFLFLGITIGRHGKKPAPGISTGAGAISGQSQSTELQPISAPSLATSAPATPSMKTISVIKSWPRTLSLKTRLIAALIIAVVGISALLVLLPTYLPPASHAELGNTEVQVWVNTASGVYHCPDSPYYGKTAHGAYMKQSEAQANNYRPAWYRVCE